ncbi:MAG TPA: hypothetical protein DEH78_20980 [Solibacterales bacterium]|nr:hypothetical protein [Bryobacterales bacterium]
MERMLITGTSGFIGSHMVRLMAEQGRPLRGLDRNAPKIPFAGHRACDIRHASEFTAEDRNPVVIHLAAEAEVVIPFDFIPTLMDSNVNGTANVLRQVDPRVTVFASSGAVYGDSGSEPVSTAWRNVNPVGIYGMSKAAGELVLEEWARSTGRAAVSFRFGNVTGARCKGLIPYLVRHALQHPKGDVPAHCRGGGRIVRDYVPVWYTIRILDAAARMEWPAGSHTAFNIGTGRGTTNGEVAAIVQAEMEKRGCRLNIAWSPEVAPGEAAGVVLDMSETVKRFGCEPPSGHAVREAIDQAIASYLPEERA